MSKISSLLFTGIFLLSLTAYSQTKPAKSVTSHVNPFIGTLGGGNVFAGACLPHGFVKLGPDTEYNSYASGYQRNKNIEGFSHLHISGMGGPMYGNIQLIPTTGRVESMKHSSAPVDEAAGPGYYNVGLKKYGTRAELTTTAHAGFHRYTFPKSNNSHILVDVGATLYGVDKSWSSSMPIGGEVHVDAKNNAVYGHNSFKGGRSTIYPWKVYFYAKYDTPISSFGTWRDSLTFDGKDKMNGAEIGAYLNFNTTEGQQILVKVGISMVSVEKARQNLDTEISDWNFEKIRIAADEKWNKELSKIELETTSQKEATMFYTALYHALITPSDWTGENPVFDYNRPYYEDFLCVWDLFRTVTPLFTLISTKEQIDMLNSMLDVYRHDGWLADAHSSLQREFTQVGTNTDVLFADAYVKNLKGIDYKMAYEAVRKNADDTSFMTQQIYHAGRSPLNYYKKYHYVPADAKFKDRKLTVSRTMEYSYNDFCVSQLADGLKLKEDNAEFRKRSLWYRNLWDPSLKLVRGKNMDGSWISPYDPHNAETGINFYEGHAYTWSYYAPHDVKGLINLFGGKKIFVDSLTKAVSEHYEAYNEPAMLQIYLFAWAGRPDLTQKFVRKAVAENFSDADDGLPGNDDSGTTSSWYLWSRMGIFPVTGQDLYIIGSPSNANTVIHLESGKDVRIVAKNASETNIYIQSAKLNGKRYKKPFFTHGDLVNGATFEFVMGPKPSKWGRTKTPPSLSDTL